MTLIQRQSRSHRLRVPALDLAVPSGPTFNPLNYGDAFLSLSSLNITAANLDGANVVTWPDASGVGDASSAGLNPPVFIDDESGPNGLPYVSFEASSTQELAIAARSQIDPYGAFGIIAVTLPASSAGIRWLGIHGSNQCYAISASDTRVQLRPNDATNGLIQLDHAARGTANWKIDIVSRAAGSSTTKHWLNGVLSTTTTSDNKGFNGWNRVGQANAAYADMYSTDLHCFTTDLESDVPEIVSLLSDLYGLGL